ncbi:MAG: alpha/beta fold hydrolase [Quisquiliibacterium sp.]
MSNSRHEQQLWLELPPISAQAPRRLLVFLHGAGSSPEVFAPVAIAWQLKFPGATAAILQGLEPAASGSGRDWFDPRGDTQERALKLDAALETIAQRVQEAQRQCGATPDETVLIGFSQGATVALELARAYPHLGAIVVAYAGRLSRPIRGDERLRATIHLIHGELDSLVPVVHARQALRGLQAGGAQVTLDIIEDGSHTIGQDMVIVGTTRVLQTIFKGRRRPIDPSGKREPRPPVLH